MSEEWVRFSLTAELRSDAHFGSGSGGGGIDALVARDRHDRPVIWASHLEGVMRDAARRLRGDQAANAFFGGPGGDRQRAVFTSLYAKGDPGSHVWRSTARESFDNRAPKDETLRVVEFVPRGTRFDGHVELPKSDLEFLRRLVREVDALGGGRAPGSGRVKLTLAERHPEARSIGSPQGRLLLLLKNIDPLCITATATPDNLIPSFAFVPGRTLLGALAAWLIAEGDRETASLLVGGRVSVGDALPVPVAPARLDVAEVIPAPLALQTEKPGGVAGNLPWWAGPRVATPRRDALPIAAKLKRPEEDLFVFRSGPNDAWMPFRPLRRIRLRNGRPADPRQPDASLFAIEQIVEETHFLCELRGAPEDMASLAAQLAPVLEGRRWLRLGRGGIPVEVSHLVWSGDPVPTKTSSSALLTLTSDLLVRDDLLRWCTTLDANRLADLHGWPGDVQIGKSIQDSAMVRGFNGTSGLWRMPAAAIRRGSVFEVNGPGVAELAARAAKGAWLGERTHEGFGRFRLDDVLPGVTNQTTSAPAGTPVPDAVDEAAASMTRNWFQERKALAMPGTSSDRRPSLSQWLELVAELERGGNPLESCLHPTTAGERNWSSEHATAILLKLRALPSSARAVHARLFVRWLRAEMRNSEARKKGAQ